MQELSMSEVGYKAYGVIGTGTRLAKPPKPPKPPAGL